MKPVFILAGLLFAASLGLNGQQACSSDWVPKPDRDPVKGEPFVSACKRIPFAGRGAVEVTARCRVDPTQAAAVTATSAGALKQLLARMTDVQVPETKVDARVFELLLTYVPARGSELSLLSTHFAGVATVNRMTGTVIVSPPTSCPVLRVNVDGAGGDHVPSNTCNVTNVASIVFAATSLRQGMQEFVGKDADYSCDPLKGAPMEFMGLLYDAADPSVVPMRTALDSGRIAIGLPLSDGSSVAAVIDPQSAAFRTFATACLAAFPDPPKPEVKVARGGPLGIEVAPIVLTRKTGAYDAQSLMHAVQVTQTYPDSPVRLAGIGFMDIITAVNSQPVHDAADVSKALADSRNPCHAEVTVYRDGHLAYFDLKPNRAPGTIPMRTDSGDATSQLSKPGPVHITGATDWSVRPMKDRVFVQYIATSAPGTTLVGVELWRATDDHGKPGRWEKIAVQDTVSSDHSVIFFPDKPAPGKYWYGTHVYDSTGHYGVEPEPVLVTVER